MVSTHGYVAAEPPLGAADTGGQVVYVLELAKKFAQLGFEVDIWTRRFEDQPEMDVVNDRVRVLRVPCGGRNFLGKENLVQHLPEWAENALRFIKQHGLKYQFFNSHYWDAGCATQRINQETLLYRSCDEVIATTPDQLDMIVKDYGAPAKQVHRLLRLEWGEVSNDGD
ncbi:MAG: mannosylfructose-phosphate synthase [Verrucomicrobiota bacterium]|nr:mannosylfructose-phosphate synthase [Verrucomicrobiota bacterium]